MRMFYLAIIIAVLSSTLYHVFQKAISPDVNPAISLMITYAIALFLSALLLIVFPVKSGLAAALRGANWASFALGFAIIGLEVGFLLAYRWGGNLSVTAIAANTASGLLLIPVGIVLFREKPSLINIAGVFVAILGLIMINNRQ
jgi:drug/metabolite transporter (DMT)-like permease